MTSVLQMVRAGSQRAPSVRHVTMIAALLEQPSQVVQKLVSDFQEQDIEQKEQMTTEPETSPAKLLTCTAGIYSPPLNQPSANRCAPYHHTESQVQLFTGNYCLHLK